MSDQKDVFMDWERHGSIRIGVFDCSLWRRGLYEYQITGVNADFPPEDDGYLSIGDARRAFLDRITPRSIGPLRD